MEASHLPVQVSRRITHFICNLFKHVLLPRPVIFVSDESIVATHLNDRMALSISYNILNSVGTHKVAATVSIIVFPHGRTSNQSDSILGRVQDGRLVGVIGSKMTPWRTQLLGE